MYLCVHQGVVHKTKHEASQMAGASELAGYLAFLTCVGTVGVRAVFVCVSVCLCVYVSLSVRSCVCEGERWEEEKERGRERDAQNVGFFFIS